MSQLIVRIDLTNEQHIRLMLTLLNERSIIKQAIGQQSERGDEVPKQWTQRLEQLNELIKVIQNG